MTLITNQWQHEWSHPPKSITPHVWSWLSHEGSLTERLQGLSPKITLNQINEGWVADNKCGVLARDDLLAKATRLWQRRITFCEQSVPLVFAHSLIPETPQAPIPQAWKNTGKVPLGQHIFQDPNWKRTDQAWICVTSDHPEFAPAAAHCKRPPKAFWGRRSWLIAQGHRALVTEIFLPAFWARVAQGKHAHPNQNKQNSPQERAP